MSPFQQKQNRVGVEAIRQLVEHLEWDPLLGGHVIRKRKWMMERWEAVMTMVVEREETKDEEEGEDEDKVEALTKHEEDHNQEEVHKCSSYVQKCTQ